MARAQRIPAATLLVAYSHASLSLTKLVGDYWEAEYPQASTLHRKIPIPHCASFCTLLRMYVPYLLQPVGNTRGVVVRSLARACPLNFPRHSLRALPHPCCVCVNLLPQAQLRGFFCFQVQKHHYVAFVYNRGRQEWLLLDDDQAVPVSNVLISLKLVTGSVREERAELVLIGFCGPEGRTSAFIGYGQGPCALPAMWKRIARPCPVFGLCADLFIRSLQVIVAITSLTLQQDLLNLAARSCVDWTQVSCQNPSISFMTPLLNFHELYTFLYSTFV